MGLGRNATAQPPCASLVLHQCLISHHTSSLARAPPGSHAAASSQPGSVRRFLLPVLLASPRCQQGISRSRHAPPLLLLICLLQGMCHLHASNIVHGDLKPGNVLLRSSRADRRGFVAKVADFGLSKMLFQVGLSPCPPLPSGGGAALGAGIHATPAAGRGCLGLGVCVRLPGRACMPCQHRLVVCSVHACLRADRPTCWRRLRRHACHA